MGLFVKYFILLSGFLFLFTAGHATEERPKTQDERLKEAGALYFAYKPDEAFDEYISLSKETNNRQAFLNAAFIAMEKNEPKKAVDIAQAAYKIYPKDREAIEMSAEAFLADGQ